MVGRGSLIHNHRIFMAENINKERISDNVIYQYEGLKQVYEELFGAAFQRYNDKQKHSDRKIENNFMHIKKGRLETAGKIRLRFVKVTLEGENEEYLVTNLLLVRETRQYKRSSGKLASKYLNVRKRSYRIQTIAF